MVVCDVIVCLEDKEYPLQKAVLQLASPVLNQMISDEVTPTPQVVTLPGKAKEFEEFLRFIYPPTHRTFQLTADNVDFLLHWFDQYQIPTLKEECENLLLTLPVTEERLLQASKYQLKRQQERCIEEIAMRCEDFAFERLTSCPEILPPLLMRMKEIVIMERMTKQSVKKRILTLL